MSTMIPFALMMAALALLIGSQVARIVRTLRAHRVETIRRDAAFQADLDALKAYERSLA